MIKLTVEIKDEKFLFDYEVGSAKHSGSEIISPDTLAVFSQMLHLCFKSWMAEYNHKRDETLGKIYVEQHPELLKKKHGNRKEVM